MKRACRKRVILVGLVLALALGIAPGISGQTTAQPEAAGNCVACHTNQGIMEGLAGRQPVKSEKMAGDCCAADLPPMEAWQQIYVGDAEFLASIHNLYGCIGCHGGQDEAMDRHIAHQGMNPDPTSDPGKVCGDCHSTEVEMSKTGLHLDLTGFRQILAARGADFENPQMQQAFDQQCYTCHASCGQCHMSRPSFTGGGLMAGHAVQEFPATADTCRACHGARAANELTGAHKGAQASVHWQEGMDCYDCHNITQFHGSGTPRTHRYDGEGMPSCLDCHSDSSPEQTEENLAHDIHWEKLACSVCHASGPYQNCYSCHVATDEEGLPYYTTEESQMQFKIGRNPLPSQDHPWEYVLVRHVPVEPDTFAFYGDMLLQDFDNLPTWKLTTPHNIQRATPQNATCNNCHGNADLFLTADDVRPARWQANQVVMVEQIPPEIELGQEEETAGPVSECAGEPKEATHVIPESCQPQTCTQCHPGTHQGDWTLANENIHTLYALVEPKGEVIICEDCHAPDGNFDWAAEGYTSEETAALIWDQFPEIQPLEKPVSHPLWVVGVGLVLAVAAGAPVVMYRERKNTND